MEWIQRIWVLPILFITNHPLGSAGVISGLVWWRTRALIWELLVYNSAETLGYTWRITSGNAKITARHAGIAVRPAATAAWSRARVVGASPITWGVVAAVASTVTDVNLQVKHGAGVWGNPTFGAAPSLHLEDGEPWWM